MIKIMFYVINKTLNKGKTNLSLSAILISHFGTLIHYNILVYHVQGLVVQKL